jgi:tyrosyl-tRNA synthetase
MILIADSYGFLINHDVSLETVDYRSRYYSFLLNAVLGALGVPTSKIVIKRESEYSMTPRFFKDTMRMCAVSSLEDIRGVGPDVSKADVLSPSLCPISQALSEVYTGCDFQLGGLDQVSDHSVISCMG